MSGPAGAEATSTRAVGTGLPSMEAARGGAHPPHVARALGESVGAQAGAAAGPTGSAGLTGLAGEPPPAPPTGRRLTARALRLLTVAVTAAAAALVLREAWLLAPAAGAAVLLVLGAAGSVSADSASPVGSASSAGSPSPAAPTPVATGRPAPGSEEPRLVAAAEVTPRRCFEGERITARITLDFDGAASWVDPGIHLGPGVRLESLDGTGPVLELVLVVPRWGHPALGTVDIDVHDAAGLSRRTVRVDLGRAQVFPRPNDGRLTPIPVRLPALIGEHTARQHAEGLEVVGVHPYSFGERQRRIHWPATTRRGEIQLNRFAAERAADTVLLIDALADFTDQQHDTSSLDESVRAAAGIARAYLRSHDRVGIATLGAAARWLRPGTGDGYFYRIVESVLDAREAVPVRRRDHAVRLSAAIALGVPADALVYALTPLADQRILDVLGELTARGNPVVVIEMPTGAPAPTPANAAHPADRSAALAVDLWQLEREAIRATVRAKGIPVVTHQPGESLDLPLAPLLRSRIPGRSQ